MFLPKHPFSKSNHFGIALSDSAVRVVLVDSQGNVVFKEEVIFPNPIINGEEVDQDSLSQALKDIISHTTTPQYAAVCLPEKYAYSRVHSFPHLSTAEISEAINWQLEKIFPFSQKEIYFDWKYINQDKQNATILITVIPRTLLDRLKAALHAAGIFPISFEPSASALTRLVNDQTPSQIIIELNTFSTNATLVINQVSSLTTTTSFTAETSPQEVLNQITTSIHSLVNYMTANHLSDTPPQIFLTGEKASNQLAQILSDTLSLNTQMLQLNDLDPRYHPAFIAAKTQILPPTSEKTINLLPPPLQIFYQAQSDYTLAQAAIKYVIVLSLITILTGGLGFAGLTLIAGRTATQKTNLETQTVTQPSSGFDLAKVNQKANYIVQLFPLKKSPEADITDIYTAVPPGVVINNLTVIPASKQYTLAGTAETREDLLVFKDKLEQLQKFSKINIPLETLEINTDINYSLSFTLLAK